MQRRRFLGTLTAALAAPAIISRPALAESMAVSPAGSGTSGLFGPALGTLPSAASTGLNTWYSQGSATIADTTAGVYLDIDASHNGIVGRYKTAPATPYTITALIGITPSTGANAVAGIGFTDATKLHFVDAGDTPPWGIQVAKWTNATTFSALDFTGPLSASLPVWLRIKDDGTNVFFYDSGDGVNFVQRFTATRAAGFLGASGYTNIGFFGRCASAGSNETGVTLLSWTQA